MSYISVDFPQIQNKGAGMLKNYSVILYPVFIPTTHRNLRQKREVWVVRIFPLQKKNNILLQN